MIKIDKLSKKYDKDYVLKDLSCTIKDNSIYGLVGANGSGKSTLLRTIMGIYDTDGGDITVDGRVLEVAVSEGFAEIKPESVVIIVDTAEWPDEIDVKRAERAKERAEERMRQHQSTNEYYHTKAALSRAMNRLRITSK